ncbi:MAG: hypothetical protein H0U45_10885 [Tatlockia sp.]|nr:hypothetical protein [Tatlockia sp.]
MLKQLFCLTTISAVLIPCLSASTFARPLSINSQYPEVLNPKTNSSICYMETNDGRTLNLNILCTKKLESNPWLAPTLKPAAPVGVSKFKSSNTFISTKCYFVDNNGRPCNTSN